MHLSVLDHAIATADLSVCLSVRLRNFLLSKVLFDESNALVFNNHTQLKLILPTRFSVCLYCGVWQMNRLDAKIDQALQLLTRLTRSQSPLDTNHKEHKE